MVFVFFSTSIFLANGVVEQKIRRIKHEPVKVSVLNLKKTGYLDKYSNMVELGNNFNWETGKFHVLFFGIFVQFQVKGFFFVNFTQKQFELFRFRT